MILPILTIFLLKILITQSEEIHDPSLKPASPFSADDDAEEIRKQMMKSSIKMDRDKISKIFFHRTYDQRKKVEDAYNQKFCQQGGEKCPFHSAVKDISVGALEQLYVQALETPESFLAATVEVSIETKDYEVGAIEEVVCANDKAMKDRISSSYCGNIEEDLKKFRSEDQDYQKVMLNYCWKGFSQDKKISPEDANNQAQELRKIDFNTDKEGFKKKLTELLDKYSEPDLKQIFQKYRNDKNGIDDAVNQVFETDRAKRAYNTLVRYLEDTCKFYAGELHDTVRNKVIVIFRPTKITRIILTRSERDLLCIFKTYKDTHDGKTFTNHLQRCAGVQIPGEYSILVWKTLKKNFRKSIHFRIPKHSSKIFYYSSVLPSFCTYLNIIGQRRNAAINYLQKRLMNANK